MLQYRGIRPLGRRRLGRRPRHRCGRLGVARRRHRRCPDRRMGMAPPRMGLGRSGMGLGRPRMGIGRRRRDCDRRQLLAVGSDGLGTGESLGLLINADCSVLTRLMA